MLSPAAPTLYTFPDRAYGARLQLECALGGEVWGTFTGKTYRTYCAHSPDKTAAELHSMFSDPYTKLVVTAVGGFCSNSILQEIDWDLLARSPTAICGYSDATALLLAIYARTQQVVIHGPAYLSQWGDPRGPLSESKSVFLSTICNTQGTRELKYTGYWKSPRTDWSDKSASFHDAPSQYGPWRTLIPGSARGALVGGNVETLNMLIGTAYTPCFTGAIVFMEATGAEAYLPRLHRALVHLRHAGIFAEASGIIFGRSPDAAPCGDTSLDDVVLDVVGSYGVPTVIDVDLGHTEPMMAFPIGCAAILDARKPEPKLVIEEPAVS